MRSATLPRTPLRLLPGYREAQKARALEIYRSGPNAAPESLIHTVIADVFDFVVSDFAEIYRAGTGHQMRPEYVRGLRNDILIALAAIAKADDDLPDDTGPDPFGLRDHCAQE